MKYMTDIMVMLLIVLVLTGCRDGGDVSKRVENSNNVDKIINEQIEQAEAENNSDNREQETQLESNDILNEQETLHEPESIFNEYEHIIEENDNMTSDVDYDLTNMSSDMVYAIVYHMMVAPDTYIGKTIRIEGLYYGGYYEPTAQYYHYCIIEDALACCAQGMEFVWEDGSHVYPDEYPKENENVVVEGTFETYKDEGDDYLYCRLQNSTMVVIDEQ